MYCSTCGSQLPEGTAVIEGKAVREYFEDSSELYTEALPLYESTTFRAIPYALWQNRGASNMAVWVREK